MRWARNWNLTKRCVIFQAARDRIGNPRLLAGPGDPVAEQVNEADTNDERHQHLPARDAQSEQTAGENVSTDAMHIRHPEREDVVPIPVLVLQGTEVLVVQAVAEPGTGLGLTIAKRFTEIVGGTLSVGV